MFPAVKCGCSDGRAVWITCVVMLASLAGCQGGRPPGPSSTPTSPAIETTADLLRALEAAGVQVNPAGGAVRRFGVEGASYMVDGQAVDVYAFPDSASRKTAGSEISADGRSFQGSPSPGLANPHLWGIGRLLVLYDGDSGGTILLLSGLLGDPMTAQPSQTDEPFPPAVAAAVEAVANEQQVAPQEVVVVRFESAQWTDGCLGLGAPDETCRAGPIDGWLIELQVHAEVLQVRTDELGSIVRWR